jgi:hypothetical protein
VKAAIAIAAAMLAIAALTWKLCFVHKPTAAPTLPQKWHDQAYGLDAGEAARFIPPPYSSQRMQDFGRGWSGRPPKDRMGQLVYHVLPTRTQQWGMSSANGELDSSFTFANQLTAAHLDIHKNLKDLPVNGDWVIRINDPIDRRVKAMESILSAIVKKDLVIEKKEVEQDVIVVRGKWNFTPVEGAPPRRTNSVHFYVGKIDEQEGAGGGSGDFRQLMFRLEEIAGRKVIEEVEVKPTREVEWSNNRSDDQAHKSESAMIELLENLGKQTGLEYIRTRRAIPKWYVREKSATTQPGI